MPRHVNLIKLCVGCESVESLDAWQKMRGADYADGRSRHVTRMWPKREAELLAGGSLYWIIKGQVAARQRIMGLEEVIGADGIRRCGIVLDRKLVRVAAAPRRAFQGWRYLSAEDAPADLPGRAGDVDLPPELSAALADIGIL